MTTLFTMKIATAFAVAFFIVRSIGMPVLKDKHHKKCDSFYLLHLVGHKLMPPLVYLTKSL